MWAKTDLLFFLYIIWCVKISTPACMSECDMDSFEDMYRKLQSSEGISLQQWDPESSRNFRILQQQSSVQKDFALQRIAS